MNNAGTVTGQVVLGAASSFNNAADGSLVTAGSIELGSGGRLDNAGLIDIAGSSAAALRVNGDAQGVVVTPHAALASTAAASGFSPTRQAAAGHLQAGFTPELSERQSHVFAQLANLDSPQRLGQALDSLGGEVLQTAGLARLNASLAFSERMNMSNCALTPVTGTLAIERDCAWSRLTTSDITRRSDDQAPGCGATTQMLQAGGQRRLGDGWVLGAGVSYDHSRLDADGGAGGVRGDTLSAALMLKRESGPWFYWAGIDVGHGRYDSRRTVGFGDVSETASASYGMWHAGRHGRVGALLLGQGEWGSDARLAGWPAGTRRRARSARCRRCRAPRASSTSAWRWPPATPSWCSSMSACWRAASRPTPGR